MDVQLLSMGYRMNSKVKDIWKLKGNIITNHVKHHIKGIEVVKTANTKCSEDLRQICTELWQILSLISTR